MSIINQMLQKLEQRGGGRGAPLSDGVRAVATVVNGKNRTLLLGVIAAIVLSAGGYYGWLRWQHRAKPVKSVAVAGKIPGAVSPSQPSLPQLSAKAEEIQPQSAVEENTQEELIDLSSKHAQKTAAKITKDAASGKIRKSTKGGKADEVGAVSSGESLPSYAKSPSRESVGKIRIPHEGQDQAMKSVTPQQQALFHYQKALSLLQQGRVAEARSSLEETLRLDPHHLAARQAFAGLLVEQRQYQQAEFLLQEGVNLNAEQYGCAMALARLQVERGDIRTALDTLFKSLPHAVDNAGYQAFLAALLQRSEQHKKAIEHYQAALRLASSGTWQMGLGVSLQAENRLAEAQEAFVQAKASNELAPDLSTFVDQRLRMLKKLLQIQTSGASK